MGIRDYKQFGIGEYFHVYNRGNGKNKVFLDEEDYKFFILRLNQNLFPDIYKSKYSYSTPLPKNSFSMTCFCLMPNHFHFLIKQNRELPISKLMLKVCTSYSKYFNKKYKSVGHIFQDQFKQIWVDDNSYLVWLSAYIHENPGVAGLVSNSRDYNWSSYSDFAGLNGGSIKCDRKIILEQFTSPKDYCGFVDSSREIIKERKDLESLLLDFKET